MKKGTGLEGGFQAMQERNQRERLESREDPD